jgi:high affinity Mn2+ porin
VNRLYLQILIFFFIPYISISADNDSSNVNDRFTIHAQTTIISQSKPPFSASYSGVNSLLTAKENQTSITATLYAGVRLWKGASTYINPEIAGGSGLSQALGVAAATNGETFRIGDPAPKIYLARLYFQQIFALSDERYMQENDVNTLKGNVPAKYISITAGKFGLADFFDDNRYSHDPRSQFMSWALMDNGAWDYAANTRGYTPGIVLEYVTPVNELRLGVSLLPKVANGLDMNWNLSKASSSNFEFTHRFKIHSREGAIRLLAFYNTTNMGSYRQAIKTVDTPDIVSTRAFGRSKFGLGLNIEQQLSNDAGIFLRAGWNDGKNETWCFTEIDKTFTLGVVYHGKKWKRPDDNIGFAYIISGISGDHANYLKRGGLGFMLGDGNLSYAAEQETELYYSASLIKNHLFLSGTYQFLLNPGYNSDRHGPVNVFSVRMHANI